MQDNNSNKPRKRKAAQGKGYYIALALCLAAVGISGYVFFRSARSAAKTTEALGASLGVPVVADQAPETADVTPPSQDSTAEAAETRAETAAPAAAETQTVIDAWSSLQSGQETLEAAESVQEAEYDPLQDPNLCWPVSGLMTDSYSMTALVYNVTMGDWRVHEGIDVSAAEGESVLSACQGTVTAVYEDDLKGFTVEVDCGSGYRALYANLQEDVLVTAGQAVQPGTLLGYVGASALGESRQEPHLHLEIYHDDVLMDPVDFLPR